MRRCSTPAAAMESEAGVFSREPSSVKADEPFRTELCKIDSKPRIVLHSRTAALQARSCPGRAIDAV